MTWSLVASHLFCLSLGACLGVAFLALGAAGGRYDDEIEELAKPYGSRQERKPLRLVE